MSAVLKDDRISIEEYLQGELISEVKHEYIDGYGYVYAMAEASKNHQSITDNVLGEIRQHLKDSPCRPYGSDVKIKAGEKFFYPDIMVCGDKTANEYYTESPLLVVEVLSKSTQRNDRTIKRRAYQALTSLQEYVLIEQDFTYVEVSRCSSGRWLSQHYFLGDEVFFESLDLKVPVSEIYSRVDNDDMQEFLQNKI